MTILTSKQARKPPSSTANRNTLLREDSAFAFKEAYRAARTNLLYLAIDDPCRKIAVTSAVPSEGKSTVAANLAISLAMADKRVLLIDMDMRKPVQNQLFEMKREPGLSEFLAGIDKEPAVQKTKYNGLSVLPSGRVPKNPAELLLSKRMEMLLEKLEGQFDYILIDTPPVGVVTDATLVAKNVHGYLIAARSGHSQSDNLQRAAEVLKDTDTQVFGVILNGLDPKQGHGSYSRYGRYGRSGKYGYYSSYDNSDES